MELKSDTNVKVGGLGESRRYSFELSGEMFDSVFKNLYSRPIESIIRELTTNAIEVSPPGKPPVIHVPSTFAPTFSIRDYGPGLAQDAMFDLYTVAGASTKRTSNEYIGAFGLGAKSPFAYTDSYSIDSYHGGTKKSYLIYRDQNGIPTMSLVSTTPCDPSETGLHVTIGVRLSDVPTWSTALHDVRLLPHMPIIPKLVNTPAQVPPPPMLKNKIDNVGIWSESPGSANYLRMGGPIYPLRSGTGIDATMGLYIDAPIGSVDLTPSREELRYTQKTLDYVKSTVDKYVQALATEITAAFDACTNIFDAARLYHKLSQRTDIKDFPKYSALPLALRQRMLPVSWVDPVTKSTRHLRHVHINLSELLPDPTILAGLKCDCATVWKTKITSFNVPANLSDIYINLLPCLSGKHEIIVIHPDDKFYRAKIKQHQIVIARESTILKSDAPRATWDTIANYLKDYEIIHISDLTYTRPTVKRTTAATIPKLNFPKVHLRHWTNRVDGNVSLVPADNGGHYLYSYKGHPYWSDTRLTNKNIYTQPSIPIRAYRTLAEYIGTNSIWDNVIHITPDRYAEFARVRKAKPGIWKHFKELATGILDAAYLKQAASLPPDTSTVQEVLDFGTSTKSTFPAKYQALVDRILIANTAYYNKFTSSSTTNNPTPCPQSQTELKAFASALSHTLPSITVSTNVDPTIKELMECRDDPLFPALVQFKQVLDKLDPWGYHKSEFLKLYNNL